MIATVMPVHKSPMDYAIVQEAMGGICLTIGDIHQATTYFKKVMTIYDEHERETLIFPSIKLIGIDSTTIVEYMIFW